MVKQSRIQPSSACAGTCDCTNSVFFVGRGNLYVVLGLVASIFAVGYLVLLRFGMNFWQLFLIVIPAEAVVYFSFHIRAKH